MGLWVYGSAGLQVYGLRDFDVMRSQRDADNSHNQQFPLHCGYQCLKSAGLQVMGFAILISCEANETLTIPATNNSHCIVATSV